MTFKELRNKVRYPTYIKWNKSGKIEQARKTRTGQILIKRNNKEFILPRYEDIEVTILHRVSIYGKTSSS